MDKKLLNLGLNNGVPELGLTQAEAIALIEKNRRMGGRTVTRKTQTQMYEERDARKRAASEKPPQGTG